MQRKRSKINFQPGLRRTVLTLIFVLLVMMTGRGVASDLVKYSLCDVQVLYLFDDPRTIDWPTIYYLNDHFGCRVDLVTLKNRPRTERVTAEIPRKQLGLHTIYVPGDDSIGINQAVSELFRSRRPDIVILGDEKGDRLYGRFKALVLDRSDSASSLFRVYKVYRKFDVSKDGTDLARTVVFNGRELLNRYRDRMTLEIPTLLPGFSMDQVGADRLTRYKIIKENLPAKSNEDDFITGIDQLRLLPLIDRLFPDGPMKETFFKQAQKFVSYFRASEIAFGKKKADLIVDGYRELRNLNLHERAVQDNPEYKAYLEGLQKRAEQAALDAVGITWDGKIVLRDSPHGPRLKFLASISADGPQAVTINNFNFEPYWDSVAIPLDSLPHEITPHQSYVKEFLVDIDRARLEGEHPDSLKFTVEVAYGQIPLLFTSSLPLWESPNLKISFEPDYYFVKPFPKLDIDRVVTSMNWKAVINKPYDYSGTVQINLETPSGVFAGAYRNDIQLDQGVTNETVRIPFTISNLFELGIQYQTIQVLVDNRVVAADTGRIRIASCSIPDTRRIGFLPDSLGMLEDILSMTDVTYRPLTDRALVTADLEAYDVIVIGSGAFRNYPSFGRMKNRFETYLRQGGSLVILGQPESWPGTVLPVSFVPTTEIVETGDVANRLAEAAILTKPYLISERNLLSSFFRRQEVSPAVITPAERVLVTPSGAALLSVSRLGDGQIIFCGLPLLEMIARLDIDAIHLFANMLNY